MVLASSHKTIFDKGYMPNFTNKHFTVSQAVPPRRGTKRRVYKLVDYDDDPVIGRWYPGELQEISDNQYRIDKFYRGVLYLTVQKNYLFGGKVGQTSTTRV